MMAAELRVLHAPQSENTDHFVKGQTVKAWVRSAHESGDKISLTQNAQIVAQLKEELVTGVSFETPSSAGPSEGKLGLSAVLLRQSIASA